ncbi:Hypothetical_protein [Hexamita inflata]|uniref:Hypothetical_protein n=1 Tax=Hexamita inflata TaxID=28002 RepID=A0AA86QIT2_9EUKA|nr:Hypothetical protein HINF_LOCUS47796 [Hexamita inflata]
MLTTKLQIFISRKRQYFETEVQSKSAYLNQPKSCCCYSGCQAGCSYQDFWSYCFLSRGFWSTRSTFSSTLIVSSTPFAVLGSVLLIGGSWQKMHFCQWMMAAFRSLKGHQQFMQSKQMSEFLILKIVRIKFLNDHFSDIRDTTITIFTVWNWAFYVKVSRFVALYLFHLRGNFLF